MSEQNILVDEIETNLIKINKKGTWRLRFKNQVYDACYRRSPRPPPPPTRCRPEQAAGSNTELQYLDVTHNMHMNKF